MRSTKRLASLSTVVFGDWQIKASSLDDQILITAYHNNNIDFFTKMFYDEEVAFEFMEEFYDKNTKVSNG